MFPALGLQMKIMTPGAKPFCKGRAGDGGMDIWALESGVIPVMQSKIIETGIATAFDPNWVGMVIDRGSTGWKGIMRQAGCVDSNYRDQWRVKLFNTGENPFIYEGVLDNPNAKAIAQVLFLPCGNEEPQIVDTLPESVRGAAGWGSSDALPTNS